MNEPSAKTGYTALAGAAVTIIVWIVTTVSGIEVPAEIAAAATALVASAVALFVPAKSGKYVAVNEDLDNADTLVNRHDVDPNEFEEGVA